MTKQRIYRGGTQWHEHWDADAHTEPKFHDGYWYHFHDEGGMVATTDYEGGMRTFKGYRPQPPEEYAEKGITNSGNGCDYEGVIFSDGTVVLRWQTEYRSHSVWNSFEDFYQVHGHPEYGTRIEFDDGMAAPMIAGEKCP